jgi:two-component system KDP operon response regulator KdpE
MKDKILFVDDDPTLLKFLTEYFQDHPYEILTARSGQEAIRQAYSARPTLAVLDVMMPGMDGWEVCARLREMCDIPIILLTGKTAEADKLRGFRLGVDDYVTKPFSFAELAARIQAVLARARQQQGGEENILRCGSLVVDLDKHEVTSDGTLLALTPTEFRLLEVLARRKGKAVSEEELIQEMWGANRQEESTAVRRYIWLLRKKIEPDPSLPTRVVTVRGYGYRLEQQDTPS